MRIGLGVTLVAGVLGTVTSVACSSGGPGSVTSLPSTDPVAGDATQLCSDARTYLTNLFVSNVPLVCAFAVANTQASRCQIDFAACTGAASAALDAGALDAGAANIIMSMMDCENLAMACKGATVGEVAQCLSDYGDEVTAAGDQVTAQTACSPSSPIKNITYPGSCQSLPQDCMLGVMSSMSVGPAPGGM